MGWVKKWKFILPEILLWEESQLCIVTKIWRSWGKHYLLYLGITGGLSLRNLSYWKLCTLIVIPWKWLNARLIGCRAFVQARFLWDQIWWSSLVSVTTGNICWHIRPLKKQAQIFSRKKLTTRAHEKVHLWTQRCCPGCQLATQPTSLFSDFLFQFFKLPPIQWHFVHIKNSQACSGHY